jgi:hypothetical protein
MYFICRLRIVSRGRISQLEIVGCQTHGCRSQGAAQPRAGFEDLRQERRSADPGGVCAVEIKPACLCHVFKENLQQADAVAACSWLIARTDYRAVVTTNYDQLIEATFTFERGAVPSTFTSASIQAMATAFWTPETFVFKLHGDTNFPESLILTAQDYDRSILRLPHLRSFLQTVFINYTVFFVGYSLSDPDFQVLLKELTAIFRGYTPKHYALIPNPQEFTAEYLQKSMNIQAMIYDPKDGHAVVEKVLSELQKLAPFKKPKLYAQPEAHAPTVVSEDRSKYGKRKSKR